MALRHPHDGESYEQYIANQWADGDVRQRYPRPEDRRAALDARFKAGQEQDQSTTALSLSTMKGEVKAESQTAEPDQVQASETDEGADASTAAPVVAPEAT